MSKRRYRMYSDEFRQNALDLAETSDKSDAQIEADLGMSAGLLSKWRKRYRFNTETQEGERSEMEQLKAELKRLKRENEVLTQERDILKKAVTIFSKDQ